MFQRGMWAQTHGKAGHRLSTEQHIASLHNYLGSSVTECAHSVFEVSSCVQLTREAYPTNITLRISLVSGFPDVPPQVSVLPKFEHKLVDTRMIVTEPKLTYMWNPVTALGSVIVDLLAKFNAQDSPSSAGHSPITTTTSAAVDGFEWKTPEKFAQIESLSFEKLSEANESLSEFDKLFDSLDEIVELKSAQEQMHRSIEELAKENLSRKQELAEYKARMGPFQQQFVKERDEYQRLFSQYQELHNSHSKDALLALLRVATQEAEDSSEESIAKFARGDASAPDFIREFMERRTLYHTRAAKAEKLLQTLV